MLMLLLFENVHDCRNPSQDPSMMSEYASSLKQQYVSRGATEHSHASTSSRHFIQFPSDPLRTCLPITLTPWWRHLNGRLAVNPTFSTTSKNRPNSAMTTQTPVLHLRRGRGRVAEPERVGRRRRRRARQSRRQNCWKCLST